MPKNGISSLNIIKKYKNTVCVIISKLKHKTWIHSWLLFRAGGGAGGGAPPPASDILEERKQTNSGI